MKLPCQLVSGQRPYRGGQSRAGAWRHRRWLVSIRSRLGLLPRLAGLLLAAALAGCGTDPVSPGANAAGGRAANAPAVSSASGPGAISTNGVATVSQSVFHVGAQSGRDPFFPDSTRGTAKASEGAPVSRLPLFSYLKLVGIRPGTTRPMALINRTPFAPGEEGDVSIVVSNQFSKAEVEKVNIRCLEIRRDSVVISIAGEEGLKELRMAQGK
jgi:hypothetical protein